MTAPALWRWSVLAGALSVAGLPIYLHAPKYFADTYGVSLAAMGIVLAVLRLIDVVQDPALGWLSQSPKRPLYATLSFAVMATSMLGLFAVTPPIAPIAWFALCLTTLFTAYSFLTICLYSQGVASVSSDPSASHAQIAGWRESGALLGICFGAALPSVFAASTSPMTSFAVTFALVAGFAWVTSRPLWTRPLRQETMGFSAPLKDPLVRRLLVLAMVNAAPVAVTSTLFLFFVESGLALSGWEGPLLILFFLSAAAFAPVWTHFARRHDPKKLLALGMVLAIASFLFTLTLAKGALLSFAVISVISGATLAADMTLLPVLFAQRLAQLPGSEGMGFGLWSFASKLSLALAAVTVLPLLEGAGFVGPASPPDALFALTLLYAALPCLLKLASLAFLFTLPQTEALK